jgi:hypothetical protein
MDRITTKIVVFFTFFTAAANLFEVTGLTDSIGVRTPYSTDEKLQDAVDAMGSISGGSGYGETLIGVYSSVTSTFEVFAAGVTAGPRLLVAAGMPTAFVVFLFAPAGIWVGIDTIYMLSGRRG